MSGKFVRHPTPFCDPVIYHPVGKIRERLAGLSIIATKIFDPNH